ncbi:MAG: TonB-dependent receptor, partial [Gammaproteobacteria bacterium]|nr:TonB-dependent receptor [Gammaproteobacteria bacterium]
FLQRTPDYQFNTGAELTLDAGAWEDAISLRLNYARQGEMSWHPEGVYIEKPYGLLDARVSLAPVDSSWSVSLWGKNITDEVYRNHVIPFLGDAVSFFAPPRTYGLDIRYEF